MRFRISPSLAFESRHNLMYWDNAEYYGIGAGASGYVDGIRYKNHGPIRHYLNAVETGDARITEEHLTQKGADGRRNVPRPPEKSGVSMARFEEKFGRSFDGLYGEIIRDLVQQGLMQIDGDRVRMTKRVSSWETL